MKVFQQVTKNFAQRFVIQIVLACVIGSPAHAMGLFKPHIIEGKNEPVCDTVLSYYSNAYFSSSRSLKPLSGDAIARPDFTVVESFGDDGAIIKAVIKVKISSLFIIVGHIAGEGMFLRDI